MKRLVILSLVTVITAVSALAQETQPKPEAKAANPPQAASATPTLEQILSRYIEAIGGRAALAKLQSREARGTFEVVGTPMKGTVESYSKAPNKLANFTRVPGLGDFLEGTNGNSSWAQDPANGMRDRSGTELTQAKLDAEFPKELRLKELYPKMELMGKEKVGDREAYVIVATPTGSDPEKMYFDTQTGLLLRADVTRDGPQGKTAFAVYFEDYREVDGVKLPFVQRQTTPDFSVIIKYDTVKHNGVIDDAKFSKPAAR